MYIINNNKFDLKLFVNIIFWWYFYFLFLLFSCKNNIYLLFNLKNSIYLFFIFLNILLQIEVSFQNIFKISASKREKFQNINFFIYNKCLIFTKIENELYLLLSFPRV